MLVPQVYQGIKTGYSVRQAMLDVSPVYNDPLLKSANYMSNKITSGSIPGLLIDCAPQCLDTRPVPLTSPTPPPITDAQWISHNGMAYYSFYSSLGNAPGNAPDNAPGNAPGNAPVN